MVTNFKSLVPAAFTGFLVIAACGERPEPEPDVERMLRRVWMAKRVYYENDKEIMEVIYFNLGRSGTYVWRVDIYVNRFKEPAPLFEERGVWEAGDETTLLLTPVGEETVAIPFQWQGGDLLFSHRGYDWHFVEQRYFGF